jgi:hypothetical protein
MLKGVGAIFAAGLPDSSCCLFFFSSMAVLRVRQLFAVFVSQKTRSQDSRYGICSQDAWNKFLSLYFLFPLPLAFHQYSIHCIYCTYYIYSFICNPIPVAARSKSWLCGRWLTDIASSKPDGGVNVFCECCVLSGFPLRRADHSSREVLRRVLCLNVISKAQQWGSLDPIGLSSHGWEKIYLRVIRRQQLFRYVMWCFPNN